MMDGRWQVMSSVMCKMASMAHGEEREGCGVIVCIGEIRGHLDNGR